jgi:hypothetical protein
MPNDLKQVKLHSFQIAMDLNETFNCKAWPHGKKDQYNLDVDAGGDFVLTLGVLRNIVRALEAGEPDFITVNANSDGDIVSVQDEKSDPVARDLNTAFASALETHGDPHRAATGLIRLVISKIPENLPPDEPGPKPKAGKPGPKPKAGKSKKNN